MPNKDRKTHPPHLPTNFQIRVQGHLNVQWQAWFENLTITAQPNGDTVICGPLVDQAALYGVLKKVRNLGLPLISVTPIPPKQTPAGVDKADDETGQPRT